MNNENVKIEKTFPVKVNALYKAWTEEDALKSWWHPAGRQLKSVHADLKEGGSLQYVFEGNGNNNEDLVIKGQYETIIPDNQLVYSWNWIINNEVVRNGEYKLTVEFSGKENGATLIINQESLNGLEGIHPHEEGWEKSLNDLESYLTRS